MKGILPQIDDYLEQDIIIKFKVGITNDLEERKKGYPGYLLSTIAEGNAQQIIQGEKDLINYYLSHKSLYKKCENEKEAGGAGQVQDASIIYIAVKISTNEVMDMWEMTAMDGIPVKL